MDNSKKKILHVIESLGLGGAEKSLIQAVNGLTEFHHTVAILHLPDSLKQTLNNVEVINLNCQGMKDIPRASKELRKIIVSREIDLVHAQLFKSSLVGRAASKGLVPFIFSLQSMLGEDLFKKNFISKFIERYSYRKDNHIVAVSQEALNDYKQYIKINEAKTQVIYNSINERFFTNPYKQLQSDKKLMLAAVGGLKITKNFDYLFDALALVDKDKFELHVFGEGEHRQTLQEKIDKLRLPAKLMGAVDDLSTRLPTYDLYLHCSFYEGSSLAIFEAMACGLPQIVTNSPVHRENTGGFATYVDISDPKELANTLTDIQSGKTDINHKGMQGYNWVHNTAHPLVVSKQTASLYRKLLSA